MKAKLIFLFNVFLYLHWTAMGQFSVALSVNSFEVKPNYPEFTPASGRGVNYIASGFLYPGNYFDENCPELKNCGIVIDTIFDANGNVLELQVNPEDLTIIIGDWDCRSFIAEGANIGVLDPDKGVHEISCQTYNFYPHPLSPCPEGCYVVTEGVLGVDGSDNSRMTRSLAGGTNAFKSIRGELTWGLFYDEIDTIPGYGINATDFPNSTSSFTYYFLPVENTNEFQLDISIKRQSLVTDGALDSLTGLPLRGTIQLLEGVIYKGGTFADEGPDSGINGNGYAEWDSIGTWVSKGTWASRNHNLDEGLFLVNKQYFEFDHPDFGPVQFITDNEGDATLGVPLKQVVLGATGALMGQTGESTQTIVGQNASGGWNLSYTFETSGLTDAKDLPAEPTLSLQLYPNPTADQLTVKLENIQDFGAYTIEVNDVSGQRMLLREFDLHASTFVWNTDVSAFAGGWYGLVLKRDGQVVGSRGFAKVK